jgi:hypothetical protein
MGAPAQQPVYYDTDEGQYYTMKNEQGSQRFLNTLDNANSQNGAGAIFGNMFGNLASQSGMPNRDNPFYADNYANRNYLGNPYGSNSFANRFTPKNIPAQYPEMNMLFPALNPGLLQGIASSIQPDGAMSGAGRFLAPQTTNTQGK